MPAYNRDLAGIFFLALSVFAILDFRVAAQEEMPMPPPQAILNLGFENSEWNFISQGKYLLVKDPRPLYQIYPPVEYIRRNDQYTSSCIPGWAKVHFPESLCHTGHTVLYKKHSK